MDVVNFRHAGVRALGLVAAAAIALVAFAFSAAAAQAAAPANDNFANAQVISGALPQQVDGTNVDATEETGEPNHAGDDGQHSVWYSWTAPSSGKVIANTCGGATFDSTIGVYTGGAVNALSEVGSNDDACANSASSVSFDATAGTIYKIAVDGYDNTEFGTFTLRLSPVESSFGGDSIVWANYSDESIGFASLSGAHGGVLDTTGATLDGPWGLVLDPARDKVWWLNYDGSSISSANLSGGGGQDLNTAGATFNDPYGFALDPVAGVLYWANYGNSTIGYARTDGSGGGIFNAGAGTVNGPCGVAVDPTANRLWWANYTGDKISYANLDGSGGGGDLNPGIATVDDPCGVAVDRSANRVWWTNAGDSSIASADASGGGGANPLFPGASAEPDYGLALDPPAGKIWWPDYGENVFSSGNLAGGGGADLDTGGAVVDYPSYPALLEKPAGTGAPSLSGGGDVGTELTCGTGTWAGDLVESFLFRAPHSVAYSWTRNGQPVAGADGKTLTTTLGGSYTCAETATNAAGSTAQTSASVEVLASNKFKLGKLKLNKKKGTAKLSVTVPGAGKLALSGKGVKKSKKTAKKAGTVKLAVKPSGKSKKKLGKMGKLKVKVKVKFSPDDGEPNTLSKKVKLKLAG